MNFFCENWKTITLTLFVAVISLLYIYFKRKSSYWERKGFKWLSGYNYVFGHLTDMLMGREYIGDLLERLCNRTTEPFIGFFTIFCRPTLLVRDPELVRSICTTNFWSFPERGMHSNGSYDPFSVNLLAMPADGWEIWRKRLLPAFSAGKMKSMFSHFSKCCSNLEIFLDKTVAESGVLDVNETAGNFTTDVIASFGYGIETNGINDPNDKFREYGRIIFDNSFINSFRWLFFFIAPKLQSFLRLKWIRPEVEQFFRSIVKQNIKLRENSSVIRKDLFQQLLQLRNTGQIQSGNTVTDEEMNAQAYLFFIAGFDTSTSSLTMCMYELAKNADIQERVYAEIDRVLKQHNGEITYEAISEMKYTEACVYG